MIDAAAQDLLAADGTLTAMLATYQGAPAIFVQGDVPTSFDRGGKPYIVLQDGAAGPYQDGDRDFFLQPLDVLVLQFDAGDAAHCEAAALRVRDLLDGSSIAPAGYVGAGTLIESGPSPDDPDDLTFGRRLRAIVGLIQQ
jgi:hypothetical protein